MLTIQELKEIVEAVAYLTGETEIEIITKWQGRFATKKNEAAIQKLHNLKMQYYNQQKSDDKVLELCRIVEKATPFFVELINENIIKNIGNKEIKIKEGHFVAGDNIELLTPCNIGKVFDIICKLNLIACMYPENIDSDMLNDDINGFLNIEYGLINLYEFNSEKIIFSMELFNQQSQVDELNSMVKKIKK
jgi:hypothetical protein